MSRLQTQTIVDFVAAYRATNGISPSFQEIGDVFGVNRSTIGYHIDRAVAQGLLVSKTNSPRSIRLPGEVPPEQNEYAPILTALPHDGARFARIGIRTLEDLIAAIKSYGLRQVNNRTAARLSYKFADPEAPSPRFAGPTTWKRTLAHLDTMGFNWREYIIRTPTPLGLVRNRKEEIADLKDRLHNITCQLEVAMRTLDRLLLLADAEQLEDK